MYIKNYLLTLQSLLWNKITHKKFIQNAFLFLLTHYLNIHIKNNEMLIFYLKLNFFFSKIVFVI